MKIVELFMRWIGRDPTRDEIINAQIEDNARDHSNVVTALQAALKGRLGHNDKLRESIRIANRRTNSFADFERLTIRRGEMDRD